MKRLTPIVLALLLIPALAGCGRGQKTTPPAQSPENSPATTASPSPAASPTPGTADSPAPAGEDVPLEREYANGRFGFTIRYPDAWEAVESQNGDGAKIKTGDDSQQIRAYGANYLSDFSDPYSRAEEDGFTLTETELKSGVRAAIIEGDAGARHIYAMVAVHEDVEYHVVFDLTRDYFDAHRALIEAVASSFAYTGS